MFNNFNLTDQEIIKIIDDYKNLINKKKELSFLIREKMTFLHT